MTTSPELHVQIAGAGIGGLALAAGLRRHGFATTVYDRDVDPAATTSPSTVRLRRACEPWSTR